MSVPGNNILAQALSVITPQTLAYSHWKTRTLQPNGVWNSTYEAATSVQGSIQPVSRTLMEELGLDMQRNYVNIFVRKNVIDIERDMAGDKFGYGGRIYEAISNTAWFLQDGWDQVLAVEVPKNAG